MVRLKCLLFEETLARVLRACKKNFLFYWRNRCSTGRSCSKADQRLTQVSFSFVKKTFLWIIFPVENSSLKMFTGSVCVLLASESLKLLKIKMKLINSNHEVREKKNKMAGER